MTAYVGEQIQSGFGIWTGSPTSYTFQWETSANGTTGWADVAGETNSDYIVDAGDIGNWLRVCVVAENASGPADVSCSEAVGPVAAAPVPVPAIVDNPVVTGDTAEGEVLSSDTGPWTNTPTS